MGQNKIWIENFQVKIWMENFWVKIWMENLGLNRTKKIRLIILVQNLGPQNVGPKIWAENLKTRQNLFQQAQNLCIPAIEQIKILEILRKYWESKYYAII